MPRFRVRTWLTWPEFAVHKKQPLSWRRFEMRSEVTTMIITSDLDCPVESYRQLSGG